jgi:F0F1-type ATP synthase epsilon subunit
MVSELDVGELTVIDSSGVKKTYFVAGGFIDVDQSVTKVLVDIAESPEGIDRTRATSALDRAKKRLEAKKHLGGDIEEIDHARALAAFKRAEIRLSLSQR